MLFNYHIRAKIRTVTNLRVMDAKVLIYRDIFLILRKQEGYERFGLGIYRGFVTPCLSGR